MRIVTNRNYRGEYETAAAELTEAELTRVEQAAAAAAMARGNHNAGRVLAAHVAPRSKAGRAAWLLVKVYRRTARGER